MTITLRQKCEDRLVIYYVQSWRYEFGYLVVERYVGSSDVRLWSHFSLTLFDEMFVEGLTPTVKGKSDV